MNINKYKTVKILCVTPKIGLYLETIQTKQRERENGPTPCRTMGHN